MIDLASIPAYLNKLLFELGRRMGLYRGLNHICEIKAYDKRGKLKAFRFVRQKLMLNTFKKILAELFFPEVEMVADTYRSISAPDITGVARVLAIFSTRATATGEWGNLCYVNNTVATYGSRIRVGTSTVAPTRDDYCLGSEVANGIPTQTVGADYIAWAVAITLETVADISEAGLSCRYRQTAVDYFQDFLLFRDTFTPIPVAVGETISVTEKVTL